MSAPVREDGRDDGRAAPSEPTPWPAVLAALLAHLDAEALALRAAGAAPTERPGDRPGEAERAEAASEAALSEADWQGGAWDLEPGGAAHSDHLPSADPRVAVADEAGPSPDRAELGLRSSGGAARAPVGEPPPVADPAPTPVLVARAALLAAAEAQRAGAPDDDPRLLALDDLERVVRALGLHRAAATFTRAAPRLVAAFARRRLLGRRPAHHGAVLVEALRPLAPLALGLLFVDVLDASPRPPIGADQLPHRLKSALLADEEASGPWGELRLRLLLDLPRDEAAVERLRPRARAGDLHAVHSLLDAHFAAEPPAVAARSGAVWAEGLRAPRDRAAALGRCWRMACRAREPKLAATLAAGALVLDPSVAALLRLGGSALPEHGGPGLPVPETSPLYAIFEQAQAELDRSRRPEAPALQATMELLRADLELVVARLTSADPLRVLSVGHPAPAVLPPLLLLAGGGAAGPRALTLLRRMDAAQAERPRRRPEGSDAPPRHRTLWTALSRSEAAAAHAPWLRLVLRAEVLRALDAAAKAKQGYEVVTAWCRAVAELIEGVEGRKRADAFLDEAGRRHPRHKALQRMLQWDLLPDEDGDEA